MNDQVEIKPTSTRPSAQKWGLIHVGISVALALSTHLLFKLIAGSSSTGMVISSVFSLLISVLGYGISFYLMYIGMKEFKGQFSHPHFKFTQSLKWSAIFIAIYLVVYGIFNVCLSYYTMSTIDMSEMPEGADTLVGSPLMVILPVFFGMLVSTIVLSAIGLVVGLILKTD